MGHVVGESLILMSFAFAVLGAIYPDNRWSRTFARGFRDDWVIPPAAVRATLAVTASLLTIAAFVFR